MRVLYVLVMAVVFSALIVGGILLLPVSTTEPADVRFWLGSLAVFLATVPAIALGAFVQWWPIEPWRPAGRRPLLRMLILSAAVQLVGAGLVVWLGRTGGLPLSESLTFVGVVAAASGLSFVAARAIRRREALRPAGPPAAWTREVVERKAGVVRLWIFWTLMLAAAVLTALVVTGVLPVDRELWLFAAMGASLAALAGSAACLYVSWPLNAELRTARGDHHSDFSRIKRVVTGGKDERLSPEGQVRAIRWARVLTTYLPFQIGYLTLLYVALLLQQLPPALVPGGADGRPLNLVIAAALIVAYAVVLPVLVRQWRRARRYAAEHDDVLEESIA
ncbi:hypothetical protein [Naasia sp. SYSU D00057]|uniref:hypothetical protein n=1 Tax=Naasia sp. SYSU D00057 TaxID=2817380 RepID=UPI001B313905|nr:hypothetical protein [Naasia sp. SYSU D00057]